MPIQDNLHGALLISAIDFILSFVVIGGIGVILSLFPLLNRFGKQGNTAPLSMPQKRTALKESGSADAPPPTQSGASSGIHPGLSDQQLVVLLTAAACAALGEPVRVARFRSLSVRNGNWAAQGRHALQSHRLK
ncbi:MAG: OadG family transporter subunit [Desulfuromonadaceae bacterium]